MPRSAFKVDIFVGDSKSEVDLTVTIERDLVTDEEMANAPGVKWAMDTSNLQTNKSLKSFLIVLDPLYDTKEEARHEFEIWLQSKIVPLDGAWTDDGDNAK